MFSKAEQISDTGLKVEAIYFYLSHLFLLIFCWHFVPKRCISLMSNSNKGCTVVFPKKELASKFSEPLCTNNARGIMVTMKQPGIHLQSGALSPCSRPNGLTLYVIISI